MINTPPRVKGALNIFGFALLLPIASLGSLLTMMVLPGAAILIVPPVLLAGFILLLRKKLNPAVSLMYGIIAGAVILGFTVLLLIAKGNVDSVLMSPREIFILALKAGAVRILLMHNHPSGDPSPSIQDQLVTNRLKECGELMGIELADHIIIGDLCYYSFAEHGWGRSGCAG